VPLFGGFRIGRWFGFPIRIDYSWFIVAALVVWTFSYSEFPLRLPGRSRELYLAMGVAAALLFFLSVLLHELGHAVVGRWRGVTVEGITLFVFGGIAQAREEAKRPSDEFLLTAAGPLTSLALAGVFWALERGAGWISAPAPIPVVVGFLALLNLVLAVFNMIPGFPLDGGRIFRSIVWAATGDMARATRWATWGGKLFGAALIVVGVLGLMSGLTLGGLWAVFIGWFLTHAANTSYRQFRLRRVLESIPVSTVMSVDSRAIPADTTVDAAIAEYFLRSPSEVYPVQVDGIVLGLISVGDVANVPPALRPTTTAAQIMRPTYDLPTARPDETLADVAVRMGAGDGSTALVLGDDGLVGLVDVANVGQWATRVERLGVDPASGGARAVRRPLWRRGPPR
jgi:Zn-dependent protease/CBS domain-containing protein